MKKEILKIAGVKSEKEFYKKYPTEEAFMKAHGKAFKKAQIGAYIGGDQDSGFQPVSFKDVYDEADYGITGSTQDQRNEEMRRNAEVNATEQIAQNTSKKGGLGNIGSTIMQIGETLGSAKKGKKIGKAQFGTNAFYDPNTGMVDSSTGVVTANDTFLTGFDQASSVSSTNSGKGSGDWKKQISKYAGPAGKLLQGFQQLKDEKEALQRAKQMQGVSDISLQAARTRPEQTQRRYVRPEDMVTTGEELAPIYGTGTNILAKNGAEITNTFAPNTLYDDLGYEPLNDSERYKQFIHGGKMYKAQDGFLTDLANSGGGEMGSTLVTAIGGENAGGNIGGTIGKTAGQLIGGPVGGMLGQVGGQIIGGLIDRNPQKIKKASNAAKKNIQNMALQQGLQGAQGQYTSFMKDGGEVGDEYKWVSHTWQPQVIAKFGEHDVKDLLKPPADADMLRAGGHLKAYTPPSARAMSTERPMMQMGGELETHWGGYAEPMSYNPYLPEGGETIMFKGQSHEESDGKGNTGIGITYGDNPVEVERGEPAMKMKEGGDTSSLVVFGNLKIPHNLLGDPAAKGKNFKKYVAELSKTENKQNKLVDKSIGSLDDLEIQTPFDRLKFNSLDMNIKGANAKLKDIAQKKMDASALQTAMNDTIEEYKLKTTDKGVIQAKKGAKIPTAQKGIKKTVTLPEIVVSPKSKFDIGKLDKLPKRDMTVPIPKTISAVAPELKVKPEMVKKDDIDLATYFNQVLPYLRPTDAEELDPNQLMGEMYALSQNQLEPVQAQTFQPELSVPYDISLQDVLNENEASFRAQQRLVGYNPAFQSQLAAQKYAANQKVLGEQFRMNQAMKDQIYKENRNLLNQAKLQNLATLDQQYQRQAQAKATTKATNQAALNSIAAKYAQNKLENRTLQVYENMYNYRFDPRFRAVNMNPLFQAAIPTISNYDYEDVAGKTNSSSKAKSGKKINLNSTIVKALKNI